MVDYLRTDLDGHLRVGITVILKVQAGFVLLIYGGCALLAKPILIEYDAVYLNLEFIEET